MKYNGMTSLVTTLSVSITLSLVAACASDSGKNVGISSDSGMGGATGTGGAGSNGICSASASGGFDAGDAPSSADPSCVSSAGLFCAKDLRGFPFVTLAVMVSDYCSDLAVDCSVAIPPAGETTVAMCHPEPGKLCLSGRVSTGGYAFLVLSFTQFSQDGSRVLKVFNPDALGITQAAFTIDSPPQGGIAVNAAIVTRLDCPGGPITCIDTGFKLMTSPLSNVPVSITEPGPQIIPFIDFKQPGQTFNTSALDQFFFLVGAGNYSFCIHDFKLLDAEGNEVIDTQQSDGGA